VRKVSHVFQNYATRRAAQVIRFVTQTPTVKA
jgi:hypothetical protein